MSYDLPPHLQTLNSLTYSPPSAGFNTEQEEAFWGFMHTDDLFRNFGSVPSPTDNIKKDEISAPAPTPATTITTIGGGGGGETPAPTPGKEGSSATTLEAFLAAFANESSETITSNLNAGAAAAAAAAATAVSSNAYLLNLPHPYGSIPTAGSSSAPTPLATGINTSDIMPPPIAGLAYSDSPETEEDARITGAKRLKQLGAGQFEIEEDKRRRNTEASARFRAKKKEREQAVERRAKDLEAVVARLQADKASLENENRLLKAIVLNGNGGQAEALQGAITAFGKRKRD